MSTALLATKLYTPRAPPGLVPRPRLIQALDEGMARRLTLLSAPAGFGKTTLLSQWIHERKPLATWISLDEGDNDLARFLAYVVASLQEIQADVGQVTRTLLQSPQLPPIEAVLTPLINGIASIPKHFALVLDDFHLVEATSVHAALAFLLDHLPPQVHLIISGRADPLLPLARLRARGEMIEIRAADLRFTPEEVAAFLNAVTGLNLSAAQISALEARTEGWIAGLRLAALSMHDQADVSGFIAAFTGTHRYILDYLVEEVLARQPEPVQAFLLRTSILDRLTAPLCDALLDEGPPTNDERRTTKGMPPPSSVLRPSSFVRRPARLCSSRSSGPTSSSSRWTPSVAGIAITTSLPTCCGCACARPSPASFPSCIVARARGSGRAGWSPTRSVMRWQPATFGWRQTSSGKRRSAW